jgi:hypothetical protein
LNSFRDRTAKMKSDEIEHAAGFIRERDTL